MDFLNEIQSPPRKFSPAAFWFWYGELNPDKLRRQITMMTQQGVYNGFMHARAYLKTPYLGDKWWEAIDACIDQGIKDGFYTWLYDEYAWPSGTAGSTFRQGFQKPSIVLSKGVRNMAKYLEAKRYTCLNDAKKDIESIGKECIALFCRKDGAWIQADDAEETAAETMAVFVNIAPRYVDYLNPDAIDDFINCTHEEYKKRYAKHFGNNVPGIFFDEIFLAARLPWTHRFADEFKNRCGYDIVEKLYALFEDNDECKTILNDYYNVVAQLHENGFFKKISQWCNDNNLGFTGHIEEFFAMHPGRHGSFFNNMRHITIPGADCHDYRYRFPRKITYREPKFSVSVARAYGKERMMSEALGGAGWGCSLQEFKRGINTLGAMGINMITLHGFYSECDSQGTQADWPNSFFYQNPYWRYFKHFADYISRICYMNTLGKPVVNVGLYYAIEEMQMLSPGGTATDKAISLDIAWNKAMDVLIEHQTDVDIIDKQCILASKIDNGRICIGTQEFRVLLFPDKPHMDSQLQAKLAEFEASGGKVIYYAWCDKSSDDAIPVDKLPHEVAQYIDADVSVVAGTCDNLYINHRIIEGKDIYFVANGKAEARRVSLELGSCAGIQKLSPEDGKLSAVKYCFEEGKTRVDITLNADEACWLVADDADKTAQKTSGEVVQEITIPGRWEFLPVDKELNGAEQVKATSTTLTIPLATFNSQLHRQPTQIRVRNTEQEAGRCGRHLSLWDANWIARRPDWMDNANKTTLYFRRDVELDASPDSARICITAVNNWEMWINGTYVAKSDKQRVPETVDIGKYLHSGKNVIAVKVTNDTPMEHFNLLTVENLPQEEMISLLAQAEINIKGTLHTIVTDSNWEVIDKERSGWQDVEFTTNARVANPTKALIVCGECDDWLKAWERGKPPLLPWGDLPLFDKLITYPQKLSYCITLPAGTSVVHYPDLSGSDVSITVDGIEPVWSDNKCILIPDGNTHQMQISITANSGDDGLHSGVQVEVSPIDAALCDWRLHGLKWYSGFGRYANTIDIDKQSGRYMLHLKQVGFCAEVWINGTLAGECVWDPYTLDVTDLLKDGENEIVVIVANSAAVERQYMLVDEGMALGWNRYWNDDNIQREGHNLVSGLTGPVEIYRID